MKRFFLLVVLILSASFTHAGEQEIRGKVVSVADGDTVTVLQDKTPFKIRFYGIDCPEKAQDFGNKAKEFTAGLVAGKTVLVKVKDVDRYGRSVGMVFVGSVCVNEELIKAGFAWLYSQYCKGSICDEWTRLEEAARISKTGLWGQGNPIPPWDFRRGRKAGAAATSIKPGTFHGNSGSMVFHNSGCKHFNCKNCTFVFQNREEAIKAGFKPCGRCSP